jgi:hypothetical protein
MSKTGTSSNHPFFRPAPHPPGTSLSLLSRSVPHAHMHNPGARVPSKHGELATQVKPEATVFVQDAPEGSAAEQSPTVSALGRISDASQFAKMGVG